MLNAGKGFIQWQSGQLAFSEFTDKALALAAIELVIAGLLDHADDALDLFWGKRFHEANAVRMTSGEIPSAARCALSARRASCISL